MPALPHSRLPAPRWLLAAALLFSAALHAFLGWGLLVVFKPPSLDMEFEVPMDVELGLSDELAAFAPPEPAPPPEPEPAAPSPEPAPPKEKEKEKDAPKKAEPDAGADEPSDAGVPDAPDAGDKPVHDAGAPLLADPSLAPGARVPPGAQIAVRVDMGRIRKSAIASDVRGLLAAVPDWQALLDGSGIDPVEQLDRLLIATPNLQRSKIVVAGRFVGEPRVVDEAVQRMAQAQNVEAQWHTGPNGIRTAPWPNRDETPRIVALLGAGHFVIARDEDLPRVLAINAARTEEEAKRSKGKIKPKLGPHPFAALLSMEADEGLSLEVDGVERFVKKAKRGVPQKLRLSAVEVPGPRVELRGRLVFETPEAAVDGLRFWTAVRDNYARNALVMLLGLSDPLKEGTVELKELELHLKVVLTVEQTRLILGYVRELITPAAAPSPSSAVPPAAPQPAAPAPPAPAPAPAPVSP